MLEARWFIAQTAISSNETGPLMSSAITHSSTGSVGLRFNLVATKGLYCETLVLVRSNPFRAIPGTAAGNLFG